MPIYKGEDKTESAYKGRTSLSRIYKGTYLVFEAFKTLIAEGVPPLTLLNCAAEIMLDYSIYGNSIQDGTPTPSNPIEIESVGDKTKNLWNSTLRAGCMKFADGQYLYYPGYVCNTTPIPVEAGETYTISANNYDDPDQTSSGFVFYNDGSFVSSLITTNLTVTIPSGVNQLYYNFRKQSDPSSLDPSDITNVQLEKGFSSTSYEPYGYKIPVTVTNSNDETSTTNIYLNEPLRKIGNGVPQPLPAGYTQVEYIQSSGTQYINTGFTPNQDTKIEIDFIMNDYTGKAIYGSRISADNSTFSAMLQGQNNNSSFQYDNSAVTNTIAYTNGQSYNVVQDKNKLYVDGTLEHTFTYANFTCPGSLYLFSVNQSGTTPFFGIISVKSFKIWDNDVLVRNFIPCKNSSNVVGMYDTVNDTFYSNQGTGTFTAGRVVYADYIDFETQKVYRNVGSIDLGELTYTYQDNIARFRSSSIPNIKIITGNWTYDLMCDIYGTTLAQNFNIGAQGGAAFIWDNRYTDAGDLRNAVKGHILDYALDTPTEETITLPDILLNKGTNIISVDTTTQPSNM